jgi:drug/metabolite transporter (DMT)-like permease
MIQRLPPYLLLFLTVLFWSGNVVTGRFIAEQIPPAALTAMRWSIALVLVLPFGWRLVAARISDVRPHWPILFLLATLSVGLFNLMQYWALGFTTAVNVSLINATVPILTPFAAYVLAREHTSPKLMIAIAVSFFGVLVILGRGDPQQLRSLTFNPGDLMALLAMVGWAAYSVLLRRAPRGWPPLVLLIVSIGFGLLVNVPMALLEYALGYRVQWTTESTLAIAYVAIFPSIAAYMFWNEAVLRVGPTKAGIFLNLFPVIGSVLAILLLGERLEWFHVPGAALVFIGIWMATGRARPAPPARTQNP